MKALAFDRAPIISRPELHPQTNFTIVVYKNEILLKEDYITYRFSKSDGVESPEALGAIH